MSELDDEFEDPTLRAAVRRAAGRETAPPKLRQKVESLFVSAAATAAASTLRPAAASRAPRAPAARRSFWCPQAPLKLVAAAALVFVGLSWMAYQVKLEFFPYREPAPPVVVSTFPDAVAQGAVRAHDACAKLPDAHLVPGNDFAALKISLSSSEGITVFSAALGDNWEFKGAGSCMIADQKAAYLLFARNDERVSVFSLPMPQACSLDATRYEQMLDRHALLGFPHARALYLVVGSRPGGDMSIEKLASIRSTVAIEVGANLCD